VARVCAEAEVEDGVEEGGRVHRPLHHRQVGLAKHARQKFLIKICLLFRVSRIFVWRKLKEKF
jgi:hypothetical protein